MFFSKGLQLMESFILPVKVYMDRSKVKLSMKLLKNDHGYTNIIPMILAVVIVFALLYIGSYVNGTLSTELEDSFPAAASRSTLQNATLNTADNLTNNFDSALDIVQVTIIITILAAAVGAIFLFTRFR